jgi:hypothetical protein
MVRVCAAGTPTLDRKEKVVASKGLASRRRPMLRGVSRPISAMASLLARPLLRTCSTPGVLSVDSPVVPLHSHEHKVISLPRLVLDVRMRTCKILPAQSHSVRLSVFAMRRRQPEATAFPPLGRCSPHG